MYGEQTLIPTNTFVDKAWTWVLGVTQLMGGLLKKIPSRLVDYLPDQSFFGLAALIFYFLAFNNAKGFRYSFAALYVGMILVEGGFVVYVKGKFLTTIGTITASGGPGSSSTHSTFNTIWD